MGKNNKARRAAKAKQRKLRSYQHEPTGPHARTSASRGAAGREPLFTVEELIAGLVDLAPVRLAGGDRQFAEQAVRRLADFPRSRVLDVAGSDVLYGLARLWASGWQPAEVVRQARRRGSAAHESMAAFAVVAAHAGYTADELDPRWRQQVDDLAASAPVTRAVRDGRPERWLTEWSANAGLPRADELMVAFELIATLRTLSPLDELIPPPGHRHEPTSTTTSDLSDVDRALLDRVRNLLGKAESTEFDAEAEAFTAKAHELITRHAIDMAVLHADDETARTDAPMSIRIPVDDPYADAKSLLLHVVAEANRCRAVFHAQLSLTTVLGFAADVAATELLYTSLLVQGQTALAAAGRNAPAGARTRSRSFRAAFLVAYANRIGQRLDEINEHLIGDSGAEGSSALPVLRSREAAVDDAVRARFPELTRSLVRGGHDAAGWAGGRLAADTAQLSFGDLVDDATGREAGAPRLALPA